jgi:hypothetical protein
MATINVGDLVRITDRGHSYPQWADMYRQMGFASFNERDNPYDNDDVLRVFSIAPHPYIPSANLYGIRPVEGGTEILINNQGVEYVFPGSWHIKVTEENRIMLSSWRQAGIIDTTEGFILSEYHGSRGYWVARECDIPTHCRIGISTEQFSEYELFNQTPTNMPEQLTPEQQYDAALAAMSLQPGDVVRVTQRIESHDRGWNNMWGDGGMDAFIGNEYQVHRIASNRYGVQLVGIPYSFPIYSLELVRRANETTTTPEPTSNLENEAQEEVVVTKERVVCNTDKWNYVKLGGIYEVIRRDDYYVYVKDNVGGESRYAHHYFDEYVSEEIRIKREQFASLFGNHSMTMYMDASDEIKKLMADLYPKKYTYNNWCVLKKDAQHGSSWLFEGMNIRLIDESYTDIERLQGTFRFDPSELQLETFRYQGYTHVRFRRNN